VVAATAREPKKAEAEKKRAEASEPMRELGLTDAPAPAV
jgi:hypothetical protein